ncbi:MAG: hypothetical protein RLZZ399_2163 [Verrucomicrobiota bacterium]|jgi:hypothetical protein
MKPVCTDSFLLRFSRSGTGSQSGARPLALALWLLWVIPQGGHSAPAAGGATPPAARVDEKHRGFFRDYCVECHGPKKQEGKLRLDEISFALDSVETADRWQKILGQINSGEMPPEDARQPSKIVKSDFLDNLSQTLVHARRTLSDTQGKITMRRLNRREYQNSIRDLLGVRVDVQDLPADGGAGTFDTVGSALFMSSDQFERYLELGRKALDHCFAKLDTGTRFFSIHREPETETNINTLKKIQKVDATQAKYLEWTAAVDQLAALPENQALVAEIRALPTVKAVPSRFYIQWSVRKPEPSPKAFGFSDASEAEFLAGQYAKIRIDKDYISLPHKDTGTYLTLNLGHSLEKIEAGKDWPPGDYLLRVKIGALEDSAPERRFLQVGHADPKNPNSPGASFQHFTTLQITGTVERPQVLEIPVRIDPETPRLIYLRERTGRGKDYKLTTDSLRSTGKGPKPALWIDWLELEGPVQNKPVAGAAKPKPPEPLFQLAGLSKASPQARQTEARQILERFALQAFRGKKAEPEFIDRLMALFETRIQAGESFEIAIRTPLSVILASPGFLYLQELGEEGKPRPLKQLEFVSRLSYFLWSAPPDEPLLELARAGQLNQPVVLAQQIKRMLDSEKSFAFTSGFLTQWLNLERLDLFQFDLELYPNFDDAAKEAARMEVLKTFEHLLRNGGSLTRLLKSDFVMINGLLAQHYGIPGVEGNEFRPVALPKGHERGGLLGMAAILAMGSNGRESSPVERGAWVLRKLLHDPPPPAPANVPQLTRLEGKLLTTRERLAAHQEEPQCSQCHRKIDPIGFGLENFDASGRWRTQDSYFKKGVGKKEWPIDPAGAFYKGPAFRNFAELREIIANSPRRFSATFAEALVEYALGRPVGFTDQALIQQMTQAAEQKNFVLSEYLFALINSREFQSK